MSRENKSLLVFAIKKRKFQIAQYLLGLSLTQNRRELSEAWKRSYHPLKAAFDVFDRLLIMRISQNLWNINDISHGPYTPLMLAIYSGQIDAVRFMVQQGANINQPNRTTGRTPLMVSVFYPAICRFLIQKNANVHCVDNNGETALHRAVSERCQNSVRIIMKAGANVQIRNNEGCTPLMLSVMDRNSNVIFGLTRTYSYSYLDIIEALEICNSIIVLNENSFIGFWLQSSIMRRFSTRKISVYPPHNILDYSEEFVEAGTLRSIQGNPLLLAFQAVLVTERIFGRTASIYARALLRTALIAKHAQNLEKVRELIRYTQELSEVRSSEFIGNCSVVVRELFNEFLADGEPKNLFENGGFSLFKMISSAVGKKWLLIGGDLALNCYVIDSTYSEILKLFLYMTARIVDLNPPRKYLPRFYDTVEELIKEDPRDVYNKSLLHCAISFVLTKRWATIKLIRVLLESGADVNSKDYLRQTPIFYAVKRPFNGAAQRIVEVLLEYNAHLDCQSSEGFTIMDYPNWSYLLPTINPPSLVCQAVEVILENRIDYEGVMNNIKDLIDLHK